MSSLMNLPGSRIQGAEGQCENEDCTNPATCRVQGETDGFGAEWWSMCDECAEQSSNPTSAGPCETCKKDSEKLFPSRCWEEGMNGPVYWVCEQCRANDIKAAKEADAELDQQIKDREEDEAEDSWVQEAEEDAWEGVYLDGLHARVLWPDYRHASRLLPTLRVRLTQPFEDLPVGTKLTLRLNDYGNRLTRRRWRSALPGKRIVVTDLELVERGETLAEGSELWVLYIDSER
jgi:hypothetical protein